MIPLKITTLAVSVLRLIFPMLLNKPSHRLRTGFTLLLSVLHIPITTATPWLFGYLISHYKETPTVYCVVVALILALYGKYSLKRLSQILFFPVINDAIRSMQLQLVDRLHRVPLNKWRHNNSAEILSANNRISMSLRQLLEGCMAMFPAILQIVMSSITMWHIEPTLWWFLPLVLATYIVVYIDIRKFLRSRMQLWEDTDNARVAMNDSLNNSATARSHLQDELFHLSKALNCEADGWQKNNYHKQQIHLVQDALFFCISGVAIWYLVQQLRIDKLSIANLVALKGYILLIHQQVCIITDRVRGFMGSIIDLHKVLCFFQLSKEASSSTSKNTYKTANAASGILTAHNLSFFYGGVCVLKNIDLCIQPGDRMAIIGDSSVGKSTLARLLAGRYTPSHGEVLWDGVQLSIESPPIYLLDQDATLGSIGITLSAGERQKELINRCLNKTPEVLILDESFSAMDEQSAQILLRKIMDQVPTVILITHQAYLISACTKVYKLENGYLQLSIVNSGIYPGSLA